MRTTMPLIAQLSSALAFALAAGLTPAEVSAGQEPPPSPPADEGADPCAGGLCLQPGSGAVFQPDRRTTEKERASRGRHGAKGTLSLAIEGGRGSIFFDGRYMGASFQYLEVGAGNWDVEVRDGSTVLATGVLTVPKGVAVSGTVYR